MNVFSTTHMINGHLRYSCAIYEEVVYDKVFEKCHVCGLVQRTFRFIMGTGVKGNSYQHFDHFEICYGCIPTFFVLWMVLKDVRTYS